MESSTLTKQTNLVALPVVLHEELVSSADVGIEVPEDIEQADRRAIEDEHSTKLLPDPQSLPTTPTLDSRLRD